MTGSTLAAILIPPAGTIFLVAWLALVFYVGRQVDVSAEPLIEDEVEHAQVGRVGLEPTTGGL